METAATQSMPSVLIVEDQKLVRLGLRLLFEERNLCEVLGEAEDGRTALTEAMRLKPDIVFMDLSLPDSSGIDVTREIKAQMPEVRVLVSTSHQDADLIAAAFEAGADGYCLKDATVDHLDQGVMAIMQGHMWVAPPVADILIRLNDAHGKGTLKLSNTETKILGLMRQSFSCNQIAEQLGSDAETITRIIRGLISRLANNAEED